MEEASLYSESLIYIIMIASVLVSALCSTLEATLLSTPLSFITGLEEQGTDSTLARSFYTYAMSIRRYRTTVATNN